MLENLFVGAARDLRKHGWTQPSGDNALLFYHPEFGTHEFFKACYIQTNAGRIRRRRRNQAIALLIGYGTLLSGAVVFVLCKMGVLLWTTYEI